MTKGPRIDGSFLVTGEDGTKTRYTIAGVASAVSVNTAPILSDHGGRGVSQMIGADVSIEFHYLRAVVDGGWFMRTERADGDGS